MEGFLSIHVGSSATENYKDESEMVWTPDKLLWQELEQQSITYQVDQLWNND
jgi:hypothetical protein